MPEKKELKNIDHRDHEICRGCYCYLLANKNKTALDTVCHGNPFIINLDSETIAECPCSQCIIKPMCKDICLKYEKYKALGSGVITLKVYETDE
jgi:hypothetical protein